MNKSIILIALGGLVAEGCTSNVSSDTGACASGGGGIAPVSQTLPNGTHRPCAGDPAWCADGVTCWPRSDGVTWWCLDADTHAKKGDPCNPGLIPTCNVGQFCGGLPLSDVSVCLSFCERDADCAVDETCVDFGGDASDARACVGPHTFG